MSLAKEKAVIKINIRDVFNMPYDQVWALTPGEYVYVFDNSEELQCNHKHIILDKYMLDLFKYYPNTPIVPKCSVAYTLKNSYYTSDTHIKTLENIFKHICEYNNLLSYSQKEQLVKAIYEIFNNIYNQVVARISDCVSTIDATDFVEIVKNEDISYIHENLQHNPEGIDKAYKQIKFTMLNYPNKTNRFVKAYRAKSINENQANQCIGPRGFVTDLDRTVFKMPIVNGFIKGMGSLFEIMAESRTAAKSLNANDRHIQISEYTSRRLQLLSMVVEKVVDTDCGSDEYMDILVTPTNLENMKGKYYLDENNQLKALDGTEKHLIDKNIKIRTILGCKLNNQHHVCAVCLGKVSQNFLNNSNLGYTMTSYLMEKTTQSILSTKHLTHSVRKSTIVLEGLANKYFRADQDNNIYLNKELDTKDLFIILPNNRLNKLVDVLNIPNTNVALSKIGELDEVCLFRAKTSTKPKDYDTVVISYKDRLSTITKEFLEHIKSSSVGSDARGNFIVPLENFDKNNPIFHNTLKETNVVSFVNKISSIIETNKDKITNPYEKLQLLFKHVLDNFSCDLSILEVLIYSTTVFNSYLNDYRLGRKSVHKSCESKSNIFKFRSMGQLLPFEEQIRYIVHDAHIVFDSKNRIKHPMDTLFTPSEVIQSHYRKKQ